LDATYTRGLLQNRHCPRKDPKAGIIPLDHQAVVSYEEDDLMERIWIKELLSRVENAVHWKIARSPTKEFASNTVQ
jgi:hypothetical protein